jgi:hypothetical protein
MRRRSLRARAGPSPGASPPQSTNPTHTHTKLQRSNSMALGSKTAALLAVLVLAGVGHAQAQTSSSRLVRSRTRPAPTPSRPNPAIVSRCFVPSCAACSRFNPYICVSCGTGYQLSAGGGCRSCSPNYEQNLDVQTFTCTKCPDGYTSPGGSGEASQCYKITATQGRRLFSDENEWDAWA